MSIVRRIGSRFVILGLLAGTVAMVAYLPTGEQIGSAVERVARWIRPGETKVVQRHGLGPAKRRLMEQFIEAKTGRIPLEQRQVSGDGRARREPVAGFGGTS